MSKKEPISERNRKILNLIYTYNGKLSFSEIAERLGLESRNIVASVKRDFYARYLIENNLRVESEPSKPRTRSSYKPFVENKPVSKSQTPQNDEVQIENVEERKHQERKVADERKEGNNDENKRENTGRTFVLQHIGRLQSSSTFLESERMRKVREQEDSKIFKPQLTENMTATDILEAYDRFRASKRNGNFQDSHSNEDEKFED